MVLHFLETPRTPAAGDACMFREKRSLNEIFSFLNIWELAKSEKCSRWTYPLSICWQDIFIWFPLSICSCNSIFTVYFHNHLRVGERRAVNGSQTSDPCGMRTNHSAIGSSQRRQCWSVNRPLLRPSPCRHVGLGRRVLTPPPKSAFISRVKGTFSQNLRGEVTLYVFTIHPASLPDQNWI